jgi:hypothetical protein
VEARTFEDLIEFAGAVLRGERTFEPVTIVADTLEFSGSSTLIVDFSLAQELLDERAGQVDHGDERLHVSVASGS